MKNTGTGSITMAPPGPIFARERADRIVDGTVRDDYRRFRCDRVAAGPPFHRSFGGNRG